MINLDCIGNETSRKRAENEVSLIIENAKAKNYKYISFDIENDDLIDSYYKINHVEFNDEICLDKFIQYEFSIYKVEEGIWC